MLKQASKRVEKFNSRVNLIQADFTEQEFDGKYDVVSSAVTIHNLPKNEREGLFLKIYNHLREDGCFVNADFIRFKSPSLTKKTTKFYENFLKKNLAGKELEHWLRHAKKEDILVTIGEQFKWLREAGFSKMECPWVYQNLVVYYAKK